MRACDRQCDGVLTWIDPVIYLEQSGDDRVLRAAASRVAVFPGVTATQRPAVPHPQRPAHRQDRDN